jgi:hypothetical protein
LEKPAVPEPREDAFADLCARLFTTPDGKDFLKAVRQVTIEVGPHPACPEAVLRDLEGQRRLVRRIEDATARGLKLRGEAGAKAKKSL